MLICSIDPGVTTGIVAAKVDLRSGMVECQCVEVECGEVSGGFVGEWDAGYWVSCETRLVSWLVGYICGIDCDLVLMEDFALRVGVTSLSRSVLLPARVGFAVSCVLAACGDGPWGGVFKFVPPSEMGVMDNDRLRALGCYVRGGRGHARDAIRHLAIELRRGKYSEMSRHKVQWSIGKVDKVVL